MKKKLTPTRAYQSVRRAANHLSSASSVRYNINDTLMVFKYCKSISDNNIAQIKRESLLFLEPYRKTHLIISDDFYLRAGYFVPCKSAFITYIPDMLSYDSIYSWGSLAGFIIQADKDDFEAKVQQLINVDTKGYKRLYTGTNQMIFDLYNHKVGAIIEFEISERIPSTYSAALDKEDGYDHPAYVIPEGFKLDIDCSNQAGELVSTAAQWSYRTLIWKQSNGKT